MLIGMRHTDQWFSWKICVLTLTKKKEEITIIIWIASAFERSSDIHKRCKHEVDKNNWGYVDVQLYIMSCKVILVDSIIAYMVHSVQCEMLRRELNRQLCKHLCFVWSKIFGMRCASCVWVYATTRVNYAHRFPKTQCFPYCCWHSIAVFFTALSVWTFPVRYYVIHILFAFFFFLLFFFINNLLKPFFMCPI